MTETYPRTAATASELSGFLAGSDASVYAFVAQALWLLQIALVIHVYRTGRPYWWIAVLFMAPVVGGLAYLFIEVAPGFRAPRGWLYALKPRKWRIADLREELDESETIDNRLRLARELFDAGELSEAYEVAAGCLKGVFHDDPRTLVDVARYLVALGRHEEAYALVGKVDMANNRILALELQVLRGDCLAALGQYAEAELVYDSVVERFIGEAARAGLATVYEKTNRAELAAATWRLIQRKFRKASPAWRRTERKWYKLAGTKLAAQKG